MKHGYAVTGILAIPFLMYGVWAMGYQQPEPAPECYIGHLIWRKVQPLESGGDALHFLGYLEDGEVRITDFERSVPVWPAQDPHVLMCVQFSPSDSNF